jgi:hypothetical protein
MGSPKPIFEGTGSRCQHFHSQKKLILGGFAKQEINHFKHPTFVTDTILGKNCISADQESV